MFEQRWVTGATGTSMGSKDGVLSAFPSFHIGGPGVVEQGYLQWAGTFAYTDTRVGYWAGNGSIASLSQGVRSGPIVLFDRQGQVSSMLAPLTSFMSASIVQEGGTVQVGVVGSMESVPAGWSLETILYYERDGVTACVEHWGDLMLDKYGKVRSDAWDEFTVQYLGHCSTHTQTVHTIPPPLPSPHSPLPSDAMRYVPGYNTDNGACQRQRTAPASPRLTPLLTLTTPPLSCSRLDYYYNVRLFQHTPHITLLPSPTPRLPFSPAHITQSLACIC